MEIIEKVIAISHAICCWEPLLLQHQVSPSSRIMTCCTELPSMMRFSGSKISSTITGSCSQYRLISHW